MGLGKRPSVTQPNYSVWTWKLESADLFSLLQAVYSRYNPSRFTSVGNVLEEYAGHEMQMLQHMCQRYNMSWNDMEAFVSRSRGGASSGSTEMSGGGTKAAGMGARRNDLRASLSDERQELVERPDHAPLTERYKEKLRSISHPRAPSPSDAGDSEEQEEARALAESMDVGMGTGSGVPMSSVQGLFPGARGNGGDESKGQGQGPSLMDLADADLAGTQFPSASDTGFRPDFGDPASPGGASTILQHEFNSVRDELAMTRRALEDMQANQVRLSLSPKSGTNTSTTNASATSPTVTTTAVAQTAMLSIIQGRTNLAEVVRATASLNTFREEVMGTGDDHEQHRFNETQQQQQKQQQQQGGGGVLSLDELALQSSPPPLGLGLGRGGLTRRTLARGTNDGDLVSALELEAAGPESSSSWDAGARPHAGATYEDRARYGGPRTATGMDERLPSPARVRAGRLGGFGVNSGLHGGRMGVGMEDASLGTTAVQSRGRAETRSRRGGSSHSHFTDTSRSSRSGSRSRSLSRSQGRGRDYQSDPLPGGDHWLRPAYTVPDTYAEAHSRKQPNSPRSKLSPSCTQSRFRGGVSVASTLPQTFSFAGKKTEALRTHEDHHTRTKVARAVELEAAREEHIANRWMPRRSDAAPAQSTAPDGLKHVLRRTPSEAETGAEALAQSDVRQALRRGTFTDPLHPGEEAEEEGGGGGGLSKSQAAEAAAQYAHLSSLAAAHKEQDILHTERIMKRRMYEGLSQGAAVAPGATSGLRLWVACEDPTSRRTYYYHVLSRETTWKRPADEFLMLPVSLKKPSRDADISVGSGLGTGTGNGAAMSVRVTSEGGGPPVVFNYDSQRWGNIDTKSATALQQAAVAAARGTPEAPAWPVPLKTTYRSLAKQAAERDTRRSGGQAASGEDSRVSATLVEGGVARLPARLQPQPSSASPRSASEKSLFARRSSRLPLSHGSFQPVPSTFQEADIDGQLDEQVLADDLVDTEMDGDGDADTGAGTGMGPGMGSGSPKVQTFRLSHRGGGAMHVPGTGTGTGSAPISPSPTAFASASYGKTSQSKSLSKSVYVWIMFKDKASGRAYWYNKTTKTTTWTEPEEPYALHSSLRAV